MAHLNYYMYHIIWPILNETTYKNPDNLVCQDFFKDCQHFFKGCQDFFKGCQDFFKDVLSLKNPDKITVFKFILTKGISLN